jgi:hypothetical protein
VITSRGALFERDLPDQFIGRPVRFLKYESPATVWERNGPLGIRPKINMLSGQDSEVEEAESQKAGILPR